jgi:two-component system, NarL family, response regulator
MAAIRMVIADDTDIAREGMRRILASEGDIEIVGEGTTAHNTVQKVLEQRPDVLLLDLQWFNDAQAGIEVIKRLRQEAPATKVIAITVYPHLIGPAKAAGAVAALSKEVSKHQLVDEIRSVHRVQPVPSAQPLAQAMPLANGDALTEREIEVLRLMAEGCSDKEIAQRLGIAENTAKNHVGSILGKLEVPNRAGAVHMGHRLGLI